MRYVGPKNDFLPALGALGAVVEIHSDFVEVGFDEKFGWGHSGNSGRGKNRRWFYYLDSPSRRKNGEHESQLEVMCADD